MEPQQQHRRSFLGWIVYGLNAVLAAVLGVPAVAFLIDGRNRVAKAGDLKTVGRLSELQPNVPKEFVIHETRQDAWTLHPNEIVGRVYLILRDNDRVDAFTTICPHLGCSINYTGSREQPFVCPCHGGRWDIQGERIDPANNVAPRNMDSLQSERVRVPGTSDANPDFFIQVKYQNFRQGEHEKIVRT